VLDHGAEAVIDGEDAVEEVGAVAAAEQEQPLGVGQAHRQQRLDPP
jgi:hypothetical protein